MPKPNDDDDLLFSLASKVLDVDPGIGEGQDVPDYPPCDFCGKEFEGKLRCSMCQCAFYCGRECQRADWKKNHKKDCATMAQSCKDAATTFVDAITLFVDLSLNLEDADQIRLEKLCAALKVVMDFGMWHALDNAGAYKYAVDIDIHGAIESLMKEDIDNVWKRYESNIPLNFTELVMTLLFRNGRNISPDSDFISGSDAYRIKKYVRSSPTAFETWLESSFLMVHIFQTLAVKADRNNDLRFFKKTQQSARNIMTRWVQIITSSKASKAIFLGSSKVADEAALDRTKWIIQQISKIIYKFPDDSDEQTAATQGEFFTFTAMIELRAQEYGIDVLGDFEKMLCSHSYSFNFSYFNVAVPFAVAIMAKGDALTTLEIKDTLERHAQSVRSRKTITSHGPGGDTDGTRAIRGGGKKKGKKKGKKGRRK
jgi:Zn-finger protein